MQSPFVVGKPSYGKKIIVFGALSIFGLRILRHEVWKGG